MEGKHDSPLRLKHVILVHSAAVRADGGHCVKYMYTSHFDIHVIGDTKNVHHQGACYLLLMYLT